MNLYEFVVIMMKFMCIFYFKYITINVKIAKGANINSNNYIYIHKSLKKLYQAAQKRVVVDMCVTQVVASAGVAWTLYAYTCYDRALLLVPIQN